MRFDEIYEITSIIQGDEYLIINIRQEDIDDGNIDHKIILSEEARDYNDNIIVDSYGFISKLVGENLNSVDSYHKGKLKLVELFKFIFKTCYKLRSPQWTKRLNALEIGKMKIESIDHIYFSEKSKNYLFMWRKEFLDQQKQNMTEDHEEFVDKMIELMVMENFQLIS